MRIAMASDHAGRALKEEIKALLTAGGHEVLDFGTDTDDPADLPDYVLPATLAVARGEVDRGIFVDGVGYGSAMIANKVAGVFAAVCQDPFCAELACSHSDTKGRRIHRREPHWSTCPCDVVVDHDPILPRRQKRGYPTRLKATPVAPTCLDCPIRCQISSRKSRSEYPPGTAHV